MRIVDANVLLYAVNADANHHAASRAWLDAALAGSDSVGFTWLALLSFLRISTKPEIFPEALSSADAAEQVEAWIAAPGAEVMQPGEGHSRLLGRLLDDSGTAGNLTNDAHLAAIAIERRAQVVSYDRDFDRFAGLRWHRPEELLRPEQ